jgi:hypothetical protein
VVVIDEAPKKFFHRWSKLARTCLSAGSAGLARPALWPLLAGLTLLTSSAWGAPILQVDAATLTGSGLVTFDDVAGGTLPGTSHDGIVYSDGAWVAEHFVGQTLSYQDGFDVLTGSPTGPLTLEPGAAGQNLSVFLFGSSQVVTGLGNEGFPSFAAMGEGALSVLFGEDQSEFGFDVIGGNLGTATVDFFRRDGSLIDSVGLTGVDNASYGFKRDGGIFDIAGVSIYNLDTGGIGFDNLVHDVVSLTAAPGDEPGTPMPEPGAALLFGLGCCVVSRASRRS